MSQATKLMNPGFDRRIVGRERETGVAFAEQLPDWRRVGSGALSGVGATRRNASRRGGGLAPTTNGGDRRVKLVPPTARRQYALKAAKATGK